MIYDAVILAFASVVASTSLFLPAHGAIQLFEKEKGVLVADKLPLEPVRRWASVRDENGALHIRSLMNTVTDKDLAVLNTLAPNELARIEEFALSGCPKVTNDGLVILRSLKGLKVLELSQLESITDDAIKHVKGLQKLQHVSFLRTPITDGALANLTGLAALEGLNLSFTKVKGHGLLHLKALTKLGSLDLDSLAVDDEALAHLKDMNKLKFLWLRNNKEITGTGLEHLRGHFQLERLILRECRLKDAGLAHLKGLNKLRYLDVGETDITDAALLHLASLKDLQMYVDGAKGIKGPGLAQLKHFKKTTSLVLSGTGVDDAGLAAIKEWTHLEGLTLPDQITDLGFPHLADLTNLQSLAFVTLPNFKGPGLQHLKKLTKLENLYLDRSGITDDGLAYVKNLDYVKSLSVPPHITDAGVANLKGMKGLEYLTLSRSKVTDAALAHLRDIPNLRDVDMTAIKISQTAIDRLQKDRPKLKLHRAIVEE